MPPQVPLPLVKALRDELGISMKDAKDALLKANLDLDLARSILKGEVAATPPPAPSAVAPSSPTANAGDMFGGMAVNPSPPPAPPAAPPAPYYDITDHAAEPVRLQWLNRHGDASIRWVFLRCCAQIGTEGADGVVRSQLRCDKCGPRRCARARREAPPGPAQQQSNTSATVWRGLGALELLWRSSSVSMGGSVGRCWAGRVAMPGCQ